MALRPGPAALKIIQSKWRVHVTDVLIDRAVYYNHRQLAVNDWENYLSIIIDGADQRSFGVPHMPTNTKSESTAYKQKMKMIGTLKINIV